MSVNSFFFWLVLVSLAHSFDIHDRNKYEQVVLLMEMALGYFDTTSEEKKLHRGFFWKRALG